MKLLVFWEIISSVVLGQRSLRNLRLLIVFAAIACSILIATIALTPVHGHQQRNCDICTFAHLPLLQTIQTVLVAAPDRVVWLTATEQVQSFSEYPSRSADSRAPPSLS